MLKYLEASLRILAICSVLGIPFVGRAQEASLPPSIPLVLSEVHEGLSQGMVNNVKKDHNGYLWVATKDGLNRYDGVSFKTYRHDPKNPNSIADNFIYGLLVDSRGRIWVGTQTAGVDLFDPSTETFIHFRHDIDNENSISSDFVGEVYEDASGNILIQTLDSKGYAVVMMSEHAELFPPRDQIRIVPMRDMYPIIQDMHFGIDYSKHMHFDGYGGLWYLNNDTIFYADADNLGSNGKLFIFPQEIITSRDDADHAEIAFDANKKRLFQTDRDRSLYEFDFEAKEFVKIYTLPVGLKFWYKQFVDSKHRLWSWTEEGPAFRIDIDKKEIQLFKPNWGQLMDDNVSLHTCISVEDANGNFWLGTGGNGLLRINGKSERIKRLQFEKGASVASVRLFRAEKRGGIGYLDRDLMEIGRTLIEANLEGQNGLVWSRENAHLTIDSKGVLWGTGFDKDNKFVKVFSHDSRSGAIQIIAETAASTSSMFGHPIFLDANEDVWFGEKYADGEVGLYRYERAISKLSKFVFPTSVGKYQYRFISDWIIEDSGMMWFGTMDGVFSFVPATRQWQHFSFDQNDPNSLSNDQVLTICTDAHQPEKYLWVGTEGGGLNRLDKQSGKCMRFNTASGLPNNVIYGVQVDNRGNLWMSTNDGLCFFDSQNFTSTTFRMEDGLPSNEFNRYEYSLGPGDELCFGGMGGVITFDPNDFYIEGAASKTVINELLLFNEPIEFNDSTSREKFDITLPGPIEYCQDLIFEPNHDMITFGFANLDLTAPENNRYKFMLEGLNEEWIETGSRNEATFTDLSPGNYCLKVLGAGSSNVWNEEPTILNFRVLSPWYGTWWFRILMSLTVLGLLYCAYQYRLNQMLRFERMRNRIAQDLHDEIGSTLSSISLFSTVLQKSAKELSPQSISLLDKINNSTSEMMESMNDIVWTIKAENDSFEHVLNRMRSFASNCAETKGIRLLFEVRNSAEKLELGMEIRRNIYLIFKESLNNAVKYSECTELSVNISLQAETLYISVTDNGKGFDTEKELSNRTTLGGNGLKGVKFRANELGASLNIKSEFNQGTSIELQFPMKNSKLSVRP